MNKLLLLILFTSVNFFSQPTSLFPLGPISDIPSGVGSIGITIQYSLIKNNEKTSEEKTKKFIKQYQERLKYLTGATWLLTINSIINNLVDRSHTIRSDNENLSLLFYSKKKENRVFLTSVDSQIMNISSHFLTGEISTLLGEKMNLYDNLKTSLIVINRQLDLIESNIKKSTLKKKIIQQFVN